MVDPINQKLKTERRASVGVQRAWITALAWTTLLAFLSLGQQLDVLIGEHGLLPAVELANILAERPDLDLPRFPTFFRWFPADPWLKAGVAAGAVFSTAAALGVAPRACLAVCLPIYLSFVIAGRDFLSFQWDNLLLECLAIAVLTSRRRRSWAALFALRILLFKLYFESGIAKWQSYLGDWHDGSAMTYYYETAPLPGVLGWWAHHLPAAWHQVESWAALALELLVPWLVVGPRAARLTAFVTLTAFQLLNLATANYGFFVYLALTLHLVLLDDCDIERIKAWGRSLAGRIDQPWPTFGPVAAPPPPLPAAAKWTRHVVAGACLTGYSLVSVLLGVQHFSQPQGGCHPERLRCLERSVSVQRFVDALEPLHSVVAEARLVHAYHLFGHITRHRIEPQFEVQVAGKWRPLAMRYKMGRLDERPTVVAPHQPRVDFRLWFFGLSFRRGQPRYVSALLQRLCQQPTAVQSLFREPLPQAPQAVRIRFWRYSFTTPAEKHATGNYWQRDLVADTRPYFCLP